MYEPQFGWFYHALLTLFYCCTSISRLSYRRRRVCMNLKFGWFLSRSPHSVVLLYLHLQDLLQEEDSMYEPQVLEV